MRKVRKFSAINKMWSFQKSEAEKELKAQTRAALISVEEMVKCEGELKFVKRQRALLERNRKIALEKGDMDAVYKIDRNLVHNEEQRERWLAVKARRDDLVAKFRQAKMAKLQQNQDQNQK